jgi:hypothetical protein
MPSAEALGRLADNLSAGRELVSIARDQKKDDDLIEEFREAFEIVEKTTPKLIRRNLELQLKTAGNLRGCLETAGA